MTTVSVIVPAYNAARYLPDALKSVLRQAYQDWEVILVDDGSTDNTREVVSSFIPQFGSRLNYIYQANKGLPAARNTAIRNARGKYLALLDADDVWLEHRLELTVARLDEDPEIGIAHGHVMRIGPNGETLGVPARPPARYLSGRIARDIYLRRAHILCPTATFRRNCVDVVGYFDETMRASEDRDMWFRIAERYTVAYIPEIIAQYRSSPSSMSRDLHRMKTAQRQFCDKHRHSPVCSASTYRRAVASIYREQGDALFSLGSIGASIRDYWTAVMYHPCNVKNVYMLFRALAEAPVSRFAKVRNVPGQA